MQQTKRTIIRIVAAVLMTVASLTVTAYFCGSFTVPYYKTMDEMMAAIYPDTHITSMCAERAIYQYNAQLWRAAETVALVTPIDELTSINSFQAGGRQSWYSKRQVEVIEFFKNANQYGSEFVMAEQCGLTDEGTLVRERFCYPMQTGDYYLVFLAPAQAYVDYPVVLGLYDGKIDLSNMRLNIQMPTATKAALDLLDTNTPEDAAQAFVKSEWLALRTERYLENVSRDEWTNDMESIMPYDNLLRYIETPKRERDHELRQQYLLLWPYGTQGAFQTLFSERTDFLLINGYENAGMQAVFSYAKNGDNWYFTGGTIESHNAFYYKYKEE